MKKIRRSNLRKRFHQGLRRLFGYLPTDTRFAVYRHMIDCDPEPDSRLVLEIAKTKEDLEACFRILHDAYVASGFMKPDPSGMRITIYHALPTTTTLCAKYDGKVVGTMSMVREGVFGFPLQQIFDLEPVRAQAGNIAEISALAVHPDFRKTGGAILFPLMKFMYEYCTEFFDTRHLVIAVNPEKIELYESLLFFKRLRERPVDHYDFANGAPAVGASLDLGSAPEVFRETYGRRRPRKNLYKYFVGLRLRNILFPKRRYFTTNDPVMTPVLLDHFFNQCSDTFARLDDRRKALLWSIYQLTEYRWVLPMLSSNATGNHPLRRHQRYSLRCPGQVRFQLEGSNRVFMLTVVEVSLSGFQAESKLDLPLDIDGEAVIDLGEGERSSIHVKAVRKKQSESSEFFGFKLDEPDAAWRRCVAALEVGHTSDDLLQSA